MIVPSRDRFSSPGPESDDEETTQMCEPEPPLPIGECACFSKEAIFSTKYALSPPPPPPSRARGHQNWISIHLPTYPRFFGALPTVSLRSAGGKGGRSIAAGISGRCLSYAWKHNGDRHGRAMQMALSQGGIAAHVAAIDASSGGILLSELLERWDSGRDWRGGIRAPKSGEPDGAMTRERR